ncbi:hypothetical protein B0H19DRAFT_1074312 [Mycena capillaripes]|nr:hypothetical protein B0H19DRAFT_1074312 [Mycena capillaripes]
MTAFNILGIFQLNSDDVSLTSSYTSWHIHYHTHVWCTNDTQIAAELQLYGANGTPTLASSTVIFAKARASPSADHLPDVHPSFVFAIGHVTGAFETLEDGHISGINNPRHYRLTSWAMHRRPVFLQASFEFIDYSSHSTVRSIRSNKSATSSDPMNALRPNATSSSAVTSDNVGSDGVSTSSNPDSDVLAPAETSTCQRPRGMRGRRIEEVDVH